MAECRQIATKGRAASMYYTASHADWLSTMYGGQVIVIRSIFVNSSCMKSATASI